MSVPGLVYLLFNPALPNLLKIGKTQGTAEERARQLSGTGVPAPFLVVYKKHFADCDMAERFVHALLEAQGYRIAANREFFSAPIPVAIDAIHSAHAHFSALAINDSSPANSSPHSVMPTIQEPNGQSAWKAVMYSADSARYGMSGEIENKLLAVRLYEQAAKLGAPEAFISLSELYGYGVNGRADKVKAMDWLRDGTRHGNNWCWIALADAYSCRGWSDLKEPDNARKCFRNFFKNVRSLQLDDTQQRETFFRLRDYITVAAKVSDMDSIEDLRVINIAGHVLSLASNLVNNEADRTSRINSIAELMELAQRSLVQKFQPAATT